MNKQEENEIRASVALFDMIGVLAGSEVERASFPIPITEVCSW